MIDDAPQGHGDFAILGAGAIGSILGAHLACAGHSVVMLARGRRATQIKDVGLRISGLADLTASVRVLTEPAALNKATVLIVAMKTMGTAEALAALQHTDIGTALSIQNGVLKDDLLVDVFGTEHVLGAVADISGELLENGVVTFTRNESVLLGELSGGDSRRCAKLATLINEAGVNASSVSNILTVEWSKFMAWVGLVALSVVTNLETWKYLSNPHSALVLARVVREMGKLAKVMAIVYTDQSILPVASICEGSEEHAVGLIRGIGRHLEKTAPMHTVSSLQDLRAGRPLEIHETLGYAVQKANQCGLSLPLLNTFYPLISAIEQVRTIENKSDRTTRPISL
jgi:2-dehydropantoate 2-reductase